MSRESIKQVIERKRALYKELHALDLQSEAIDQEFLFADEEKLIEKQEKSLELEVKQQHVQLKLKRAQLFGVRFAKGSIPHCIFCFVEHNDLPRMVKIEQRIHPTELFKCERCSKELKVEP